MMKNVNLPRLLLASIICQLTGIIGSLFTLSAIPTWYAALTKPALSPPNTVFAPVWFMLYTLMGISLYLVWQKGRERKVVQDALGWFSVQLVLNALWTVIFFGLRNPLFALVEIVILWLTIIIVIAKFYKISTVSAVLLLPYLLWVSFATYLNYSIWRLNL